MNRRNYQMYGKASSGEDKPTNLEEPKTCAECGVQNPTGCRFCFRRNAALNKEKQELAESRKDVRNALNLMAKDPGLAGKSSLLYTA
ncbi:MAG: hypothetical protein JSU94_13845 [Phycisphaerales bacterium]|nr:MAG: hypothetical protein JSU94_13845 [Phycisphaerales bacterium]